MTKKIKITIVLLFLIIIPLGIYNYSEIAEAYTSCISRHAGWCDAVNKEDDLDTSYKKLVEYAKRLGHAPPQLTYADGGVYIGCKNVPKIMFFKIDTPLCKTATEIVSEDKYCMNGSWSDWVKTSATTEERVYIGSKNTRLKITDPNCDVSYAYTTIGCQVVDTRPIDPNCDTTFYPKKNRICEGITFQQENDCHDVKYNVLGTKNCDDSCTPSTWGPALSEYCAGEYVKQYSDCGTWRESEMGTKNCNTIITDPPITIEFPPNFNLDIDLLCSLDETNWLQCDDHVWRLQSKSTPIYMKLIPNGSSCPLNENPIFSETLSPDISLGFENLKKIDTTFSLNTRLSGDIPEIVFPKKVKATYCNGNSEIEKELKIKILNINELEN